MSAVAKGRGNPWPPREALYLRRSRGVAAEGRPGLVWHVAGDEQRIHGRHRGAAVVATSLVMLVYIVVLRGGPDSP